MRSRATMIFIILATLVSLTAMFTAGDASCDNVPTTTLSESCLNVSRTPATYNLCQETLQHAPDTAAVTVYAVEAARVAWQSYEATETEAERQLLYGSLPGDEPSAYERCVIVYATARSCMASVMEDMNLCEFRRTVQEYGDAARAVEACTYVLSAFQYSSTLVAMNAADRDVTAVAVDLGALIVGRDS